MVSLSTVIGLVREPLRSYNFEVVLPVEFGDSQRLKYLVKSVSCPAVVNLTVKRDLPYSLVYKGNVVSGVDFDELTIKFMETEDRAVLRYFESWRKRIVISEEVGSAYFYNFRLPREYKRSIEVWWLGVDGERKFGFRFEDSFPVSVSVLEGRYDGNEVIEIEVKFAYNFIKIL